ncbi:MAG: tetratricopeptide repeat protein, partial [Phycisphaerales bacterium]
MSHERLSILSVAIRPGCRAARATRAGALCTLMSLLLTGPASLIAAPPERPLWQQALTTDPAENAMDPPPRSEAVGSILSAPFLREEEAKDLRITFGLATTPDLDTPARRARWALLRGAFDDPALFDEATPGLDRADGQAARGEPRAALTTLSTLPGPEQERLRAVRIAVRSLEMLGEFDGALERAGPALRLLNQPIGEGASADDLAEAVETATILTRLVRPGEGRGRNVPDHKALMAVLKHSRENIDGQHAATLLAEARLLYEKDNAKQAAEAARQALSFNPVCAEAWGLVGQLTVDSFNMPAAKQVANRLDVIVRGDEGSPGRVSPIAAIVRARAQLRLSDPEGAEKALEPALAAFPNHRGVREAHAAATALRFDKVATARALAAYDGLATDPARAPAGAYFEAGRALAEARQYAESAALLTVAIEREPQWAQPRTELGLLYIQSGQDDEALRTLEEATALDPFNQRAGNCLSLIRDLLTYTRHESAHFVVRAKPGLDALVAREMLEGLEENHARVCAP